MASANRTSRAAVPSVVSTSVSPAEEQGSTNKNGQLLGRKGMETRKRMMEAARRLLATRSPFDLTALLITREAKSAPATFYVYFDDVQDVTIFIVDPEANFQRIWDLVQADYWGAAPHPTVTAVGVTWLYGFQFEIKVVAKLPA